MENKNKKTYYHLRKKLMSPKDEYKQIKGFFITLFSITTFFLGIVLIFTFRDYNSFKEQTQKTIQQYEEKLAKYDNEINAFLLLARNTVEKTEQKSKDEIKLFTGTVQNLAKIEAVNRIDEMLKFTNLKLMADSAVQNVASNKLDEMIQQKIKIAESKMEDLTETSLSLTYYMDEVKYGNPKALIYLQNIAKYNNTKGKMAKKIIKIKYNDYRYVYENELEQDTSKILNRLNIPKNIRSNQIAVIDSVIKKIKKKKNLSDVALGSIYLEILGHEKINFFDFDVIDKLKNWKTSNNK